MSNRVNNSSVIFGIILIVLGGLFLLDNYGIMEFSIPNFVFRWQSILMILGALLIISSQNRSAGIILIVIGFLGYLPQYWPVLLILLGLLVILKNNNRAKNFINVDFNINKNSEDSDNYINDVAIFGGSKKVIQSSNFKGGKITAIFGGSEIDLYDCTLADGVNYLDIAAIFGGTTLYVPKDWKVEIDLIPIFGGFSDSRRKDPNAIPNTSKKLIIKGLVLFGGGEIKD